MNYEKEIRKHEICIDIINAIIIFEKRKEQLVEFISNGVFIQLKSKYQRKVDIYDMCIERLKKRMENVI